MRERVKRGGTFISRIRSLWRASESHTTKKLAILRWMQKRLFFRSEMTRKAKPLFHLCDMSCSIAIGFMSDGRMRKKNW